MYQFIDQDQAKQTFYILQFLWRDLTSKFDIVGPYFTHSGTMESKFVLSSVYETVKLFHLHGLETSLLVGASSNLTAIKATHGHFGVYPIKKGIYHCSIIEIIIFYTDQQDRSKILPWIENPFNPFHNYIG